jgi:hypothetical protein
MLWKWEVLKEGEIFLIKFTTLLLHTEQKHRHATGQKSVVAKMRFVKSVELKSERTVRKEEKC